MAVSRTEVELAYQLLFGREVESERTLLNMVRSHRDVVHLRETLLNSEEFAQVATGSHRTHYYRGANDVDVDVDAKSLALMMDRIASEWTKLGQEEPYWSVLTSEAYRSEAIDQNVKQFYESGAQDATLVNHFLNKNKLSNLGSVCLELGCGVGRITKHLSSMFESVIAVDISEGNLNICKSELEKNGITNVEFVHVKHPEDYLDLPNFDYLYSLIVLQHNPPPVQKYLLNILLGKLNLGGLLLAQTATFMTNYRFKLEEYLNSPKLTLEMHALPMREIFNLFAMHDIQTLEACADHWTGAPGSYTFFGRKVRQKP